MTRYKLILRANRVNRHGLSPIYFKLLHQCRYVWIATGINIPSNYWDSLKEQIRPGFSNDHYCIQQLARFVFHATDYLAKVNVLQKTFNVQDFTSYVIKSKTDLFEDTTLEKYTTRYCNTHTLSFGRWKHYQVIINDFKSFKPGTRLTDITIAWGELFRKFLIKKGNATNTVASKIRMLKAIVHFAIAEGYIKNDPLKSLKINSERTRRVAISQIELLQLSHAYFNDDRLPWKLKPVLKHFLFCCYTGLRYNDLKTLRHAHLIDNCIKIKMHKTRLPVDIPLLPEALKFLEDCDGTGGRVFNVFTNEACNRYLKEIAEYFGIDKNITFNVSRHTFATTCIALGIPIKVVSEILGHTSVKTTENYLHVFTDVERSEMQKWAQLRVA